MTIRKIMIPLFGQYGGAGDEVSLASLRAGLQLGQLLKCHVETCCMGARLPLPKAQIPKILPGSAIGSVLDEIDRLNRESVWHARSLFDQVAEIFCPARSEQASAAPRFSASFVETSGDVGRICAQKGQLADLIVMAADEESYRGDYRQNLNVLLTETGRPLFIVPTTQKDILLKHAAIAWNGASEAARAVAMLLPLLEQAEKTTLLTIDESTADEQDPSEFVEYLRWHGLEPKVAQCGRGDREIGQALQEEALNAGADFMLMGAYTRSRLKSLVFGGASGSIVRAPRLPVIMVD